MSSPVVIWHDLECGDYRADLPLWRELAATCGDGGVLEVGAGTGRVAIDLARAGYSVIALERDPELAVELSHRCRGLAVEVISGDACDFALEERVSLCVVAMQTVQLFADRPAFLRCAHSALLPRAVLALALLGDDAQPFDIELDPDVVERDGVRYSSWPTALRRRGDSVLIERRRSAFDGHHESISLDVITLARLDPATLASEGLAAGFSYRGVRLVAATDQHAGSQVVLLESSGA
jgi:SAM-dependent methyltransferase